MDIPINIVGYDNASDVLAGVEASMSSFASVALAAGAAAAVAATAVVGFQIGKSFVADFDKAAESMRGLSDAQKAFADNIEASLGTRDAEVARLMKSAAAYSGRYSQPSTQSFITWQLMAIHHAQLN